MGYFRRLESCHRSFIQLLQMRLRISPCLASFHGNEVSIIAYIFANLLDFGRRQGWLQLCRRLERISDLVEHGGGGVGIGELGEWGGPLLRGLLDLVVCHRGVNGLV